MNKVLRIDLLVITAAAVTVFSSLVGVSIPLLLRRLIDGPKPQLFFNASILLAAFLFQTGFVVLGDYLMAKSGERQVETLRERLTNTLIHANMSFLDHQQSGDLTSHVINDANSIRTFFSGTLAQFIAGVVTIIGSLIALVLLDVRLSLVLVACLPVVLLVVVPVSNLAEKYAERLQKQTGRTNAFLTATFRQSELIKASTAEEEASSSASGLFQGLYNSALKADWLQAVSSPLVLLALFGAVAVIFAYGGQRVAAGSLSIGTLMSFLIYVFQLLNPIPQFSSQVQR
ncbi:ABC transporter transmembrane domain-containing protein [Lacticaseibacillus sp. 53-4]|uniref:ABC transporter transmembrane domain-containing protein n=1 Tax=Lacticaseibacillus sp. 53-4 TaxID=2799575 RepID=UPI0019404361|nr:ABC transporter transmembrane domain-containing protein [Lacticaseibacillus sp. 53-4]